MGFGGDTEVKLPEYKKPNVGFNLLGKSATQDGDQFTYSVGDVDQATLNTAKKIRQDLIGSLGGTTGEGAKTYEKTLFDELLRKSQPKLEQSLIGRGLGGSTVYKDAVTDLINKAATQAVLSGQQYRAGEQELTLNDLNALQNLIGNEESLGLNLLNLAQGYGVNAQKLAQNLYNMQLPYKATVEQPGNSGIPGAITGAIQGGMQGASGGPLAALIGAAIGGGTGYLGSRENASSTPLILAQNDAKNSYLNDLISLYGMDI